MTELSSLFDSVVADVLLSSAVVAYLGPFIPEYRQVIICGVSVKFFPYFMLFLILKLQDCISKWHEFMIHLGLTLSDDFSLITTFGDPLLIRDWQLQSLPKDA